MRRALHRETLARSLTAVTSAVQRVRRVQDALSTWAAGLEVMGFDVGVIERGPSGYRLRYASSRLGLLAALAQPKIERSDLQEGSWLANLRQGPPGLFVEDLRGATKAWLADQGVTTGLPTVDALFQSCAVLAPVSVKEGSWAAAVFMHDDLKEHDVPLFSLFALQLGSALELVAGHEQLDRRTDELDLVHRLVVTPTRYNVNELCEHALETVCRITQADAGTLHRYEADGELFELVGDPFWYRGSNAEDYRTFWLPPKELLEQSPKCLPVEELEESGEAVRKAGFTYAALLLLSLEERPVGIFCLFRREDRAFSAGEMRTAEILGLQMASLLERHRLYQQSQRLYADLKARHDDLARAQAEVVRHERLAALGELAAVMAHEVRNPLGVIFNSLTTLKRVLKPTGDTEMLLNMVGEEADRLNRIVGDLLDFARPFELVKKPIPIEPLITGALDAASQTFSGSVPVRLLTHFEHGSGAFPVDAHLVRQALMNLVTNAAQSMPRGGTVTVATRAEVKGTQSWLIIEVRDEGMGLSPRATERLFQPFFTTKATGTGLGLAVVKRIVDSHGGDVSARANEDKGTTFVVRLPGEQSPRQVS